MYNFTLDLLFCGFFCVCCPLHRNGNCKDCTVRFMEVSYTYIYKWEKDESIKRNNKKIRVFSKPPLFFVYTIGQMQGKWL